MPISIRKLVGANVYMNGTEYGGLASEVTLPEIKPLLKEHAPTCAIGKFELAMGLDKMTLSMKGDFEGAFVAASADIYHVQLLQIRGNLVSYDDDGRQMEQSVVAHIRAFPAGCKPNASKAEEPTEVEYTFNVIAYKLELDGVPLFDIKLMTGKHEVLGTNLNATRNDNLGL